MTFASTATGGKAFMQSYEYVPYQPGHSQLIHITFNMVETKANTLKFAGYSDGVNGIEFQLSGTTLQFKLYSGAGNGDQTVTQSNWNLDKLDGTGVSAINLDVTKVQILAIDLQALYSGRVRIGFIIGGVFVPAHQFLSGNLIATPYIQTANLPVRCGMTCSGTVSTTMNFICSSVISEGGIQEVRGRNFSVAGSVTAGSGTRTHLLSLRPKTTFNSIANRIRFELDSVTVGVTGSNAVLTEICIGQAITGASYADINTTYSGFESSAGTISGSPALVIASLYTGQATGSGSSLTGVQSKYPITLDAAGVVRALGTLSVIVTGVGGASACNVALNWREVR
jgi:hypothetical protein